MLIIIALLIILLNRVKSNVEMTKRVEEGREYKTRGIRVNVSTQGMEEYRQVGVLVANKKVMPLIGRRIHRGSQRWNYYVMANDHMMLKIPLTYKGKECMGLHGCDEIYDGDTIDLYGHGKFQVRIYKRIMRYIPYLF